MVYMGYGDWGESSSSVPDNSHLAVPIPIVLYHLSSPLLLPFVLVPVMLLLCPYCYVFIVLPIQSGLGLPLFLFSWTLACVHCV